MSSQPPAVGTAYFPEPDTVPNGTGAAAGGGTPVPRLRSLPRRRRPAMIALAVAMAGAGVLVSTAVYGQLDHRESVIVVARQVPAGTVITAADLAAARVSVGAGIDVIPAGQLRQVSGEVAAAPLRPGELLASADLTAVQPPGPGQQLVPAAIKPTSLPASGLAAGDHVLVVATPGDQGQPGSTAGAAALTAPVPAVVEMVSTGSGSGGYDVVDLLVADASGTAVAEQVSTGQFALVVTRRGG